MLITHQTNYASRDSSAITLARIVGLILNLSKETGRHSHYAGKNPVKIHRGSWAEAGEPPRRELEWATFLKKGEPTGKWEVLKCNLARAKAARDGAARWEDTTNGEVSYEGQSAQ